MGSAKSSFGQIDYVQLSIDYQRIQAQRAIYRASVISMLCMILTIHTSSWDSIQVILFQWQNGLSK